MATGIARGARERGRRIAFGDSRRIIWGPMCEEIFRNNPNVARPGSERDGDIEWVRFYKGDRGYVRGRRGRWIWNMKWRAEPGEMFFDVAEIERAQCFPAGAVLIEPNVPTHKAQAVNKDWGFARYQAVTDKLLADDLEVCQFVHAKTNPQRVLRGVRAIEADGFRNACAMLARASIYVGAEGGLHHAAAAVGVGGVVLFGGFIPPEVTGYAMHTNLTGGVMACGKLSKCAHCEAAMSAISVEQVYAAANVQIARAVARNAA